MIPSIKIPDESMVSHTTPCSSTCPHLGYERNDYDDKIKYICVWKTPVVLASISRLELTYNKTPIRLSRRTDCPYVIRIVETNDEQEDEK